MIALLPLVWLLALEIPPQAPPACATWQECRGLAMEAAQREDYEAFHDLAWRAVQRGHRNDTALMTLLARAQSLSGRPGDALVMLRRLADLGVVTDANESDDFRRVRALPAWPDFEARLADLASGKAATAPAPADAGATLPKPDSAAGRSPGVSKGPEPAPPADARADDPPAAVSDALRFSSAAFSAAGLAYDTVSNRFIIGNRGEHKLAVIGERSQRLSTLTGAQSAGFGEIVALEIDRREGDLWVASIQPDGGEPSSRLHKLQLISGRQLFTIDVPEGSGPTRFADVAVTPASSVLVLDRNGRRVFRAAHRGRTLEVAAELDVDAPTSVAAASDSVAYVAHPGGLVRADVASGTTRVVTAAKGVDLGRLAWIRWHRDSIVGVQTAGDGAFHIVRIALDAAGRTARRVTILKRAVRLADPSSVSLNGDVLYYVADPSGKDATGATEIVVRRLALR